MIPVAGERLDSIGYEALHPGWIEKLGLPRGMEEGPDVREVRRPAPLAWNPTFTVPESAIVAGDRLYLRAFTPEDAEQASRQMRRETEISFPEGRLMVNPYVHARNIRETAKQQFPSWIHFAIVIGETREMIGANGLINPESRHRQRRDRNLSLERKASQSGLWHRGQASAAGLRFNRLHLHLVYSWVSEFNARSAAALRKQGYREAGYIAWGDYHGTELYGGMLFDLLASEWRAARR